MKRLFASLAILALTGSLSGCGSTPPTAPSVEGTKVAEPLPHESRETLAQIPSVALNASESVQTFAFGSCADPRKPQPLWKTILKDKPDLFVATGDNVYASKPEDKPVWTSYLRQLHVPEYSDFRDKIPVIATWDDHDFGQNDGGVDNPDKEEARKDFFAFFPNSASRITDRQGGVFHSIELGPAGQRIQFLLLDTRWFRDALEKNPNPKSNRDVYVASHDKTKTLLGSQQWKWLKKELSKPADLRILVTSIQLIPTEHGFEKWGNLPHERKALFTLLKQLKIRNLAVISGDRHHGEISRLKISPAFTLTEVTASGINRASNIEDEKNQFRVGDRITENNFGLAKIDWKKRILRFELRNLANEIKSSSEQRF